MSSRHAYVLVPMDVVELHDVEAGVEKQERVVPIYSGEVA